MKTVILLITILILLFLAVPSLIGYSLMELFRGKVEPAEIDFSTLERPASPNHYLVAPEGFSSRPDRVSPIFSVPVDRLKSEWLELVESQPRTRLTEQYSPYKIQLVQRSRIFRFPDVITVQFIAISEESSTLSIYSRSVYGYSDLGVNRERIDSWLRLLQSHLDNTQ